MSAPLSPLADSAVAMAEGTLTQLGTSRKKLKVPSCSPKIPRSKLGVSSKKLKAPSSELDISSKKLEVLSS